MEMDGPLQPKTEIPEKEDKGSKRVTQEKS